LDVSLETARMTSKMLSPENNHWCVHRPPYGAGDAVFVPFPFTVMATCVLQDGRLLFVTTNTAACVGWRTDPFATGNRLWTWRVHSDDPLRERPMPLNTAVCTEHVQCLAALPGGTDVVVGTERRVLKLCLSTGRRWVLLVHRLGLDRPK
jgi:hypothetical protein